MILAGLVFRPASQVWRILLVFTAKVLEDVGVRKEVCDEVDRDRFGEDLRIGHLYGDFEMAEITAMETFFDPHVFGMAVPAGV